MGHADARDLGELGERDLFVQVGRYVIESAAQPSMIDPLRRRFERLASAAVPVCLEETRGQCRRCRFHEHPPGRGLVRHRRDDREPDLIDELVPHAGNVTDGAGRLSREIEVIGEFPELRRRQKKDGALVDQGP
jgi:hypothetical protein